MKALKPITIVENSNLARIATWKLKAKAVALVYGNKIHLWGCGAATFLNNTPWVRHELAHVAQYRRLGKIRFLARYFWEWILVGYKDISFEREARRAELAKDDVFGSVEFIVA